MRPILTNPLTRSRCADRADPRAVPRAGSVPAQLAPWRIAVASSGLGHVTRGIESWAVDLAAGLRRRGVDVQLLRGSGLAENDQELVVGCWRRDARRTETLHRWLPRRALWRLGLGSTYGIEQLTFAWRLLRHLRRRQIAILHVQDPLVALYVQRAQRLGWIKTLTVLGHGTEEPCEFLRRIDYLHHFTSWHLEEARRAHCWKPSWTVLPNFVDTTQFVPGSSPSLRAELQIPADATVVLTAAAIKSKHKRIDFLLREFAQVVRINAAGKAAVLVVAGGRGEDTDQLIQQGQQLLGPHVRFLLQFPRARMPELYRAADVFVLPSLFEMMPMALLEATASGLPCLVHQHPVLEEMLGAGGRSLDMSDTGALSAALVWLLHNGPGRRELGTQARGHCVAHFGDRVVDDILSYYRFVMSGGMHAPQAAPQREVA